MLNFLPGPIVAIIAVFLYTFFAVSLSILFFVVILFWLITPIPVWRKKIREMIIKVPSTWSKTIHFTMWLTTRIKWEITGVEYLSKKNSYLLIANHQSLLDILVIQKVLDPYLPQLRYFMKQALFWMPIIGQACWVMGYPFMKRYSKRYLKKHPEKRDQDIETTRKTCERFQGMPITLINYVEGTRFTKTKHERQKSPYQYLLKPKAGGIALTLSAMQGQINTILNTTIIYSNTKNIMWKLFQGKLKKITLQIEKIPVTDDLRGDYQNDRGFRIYFQQWLNQIWLEKDRNIKNA